jgi:hypothetical protein
LEVRQSMEEYAVSDGSVAFLFWMPRHRDPGPGYFGQALVILLWRCRDVRWDVTLRISRFSNTCPDVLPKFLPR